MYRYFFNITGLIKFLSLRVFRVARKDAEKEEENKEGQLAPRRLVTILTACYEYTIL